MTLQDIVRHLLACNQTSAEIAALECNACDVDSEYHGTPLIDDLHHAHCGHGPFPSGPEMLSVGCTRFLSWGSLTENWAQHGFVEDPRETVTDTWFEDLESIDIVALSPSTLSPREAVEHAALSVTNALKLLLACNAAWGPGGKPTRPLVGMTAARRFGFVYGQDCLNLGRSTVSGRSVGPIQEVKFDGFWSGNQKAGFYNELNLLNSPGPSPVE